MMTVTVKLNFNGPLNMKLSSCVMYTDTFYLTSWFFQVIGKAFWFNKSISALMSSYFTVFRWSLYIFFIFEHNNNSNNWNDSNLSI